VDRAPTLGVPRLSLARLAPRRMLHLPSRTRTVRLRLTLLYSCLFLVSGVALLAATYLIFRSTTGVDLIVPTGPAHGSINPADLDRIRHMFAAAVERNAHGRTRD